MAKRVFIGSLLLVLTAINGYSQESDTLSAKDVLDRMVSVYASCKSYMDKGQTKEVFLRAGGNLIVIKPFTTAFVRPSHFRFEFTEDSDSRTQRHVVWRDNASVRSWWSIKPEIKYYETLAEPIAGATGISSMSAIVVPSMLFQNLGDTRRLQHLTELSLVTEEKVRGRPAYRIQGKDWLKKSITIWIEKETFLLVKVFERTKEVELTIQYEPQINIDVPSEKLAFKH